MANSEDEGRGISQTFKIDVTKNIICGSQELKTQIKI